MLISLTLEDNRLYNTIIYSMASYQASIDYFLQLYQEGHAKHSADLYKLCLGYQLQEEYIRYISTIKHKRFQVEASLMATGTLRMASSVLLYSHLSYVKRVVLQLQLVGITSRDNIAMLQDAHCIGCLIPYTTYTAPYPAHYLAPQALCNILPCLTLLAKAMMSQYSQEDPLVLSHLYWLLISNNATLVQHISNLQCVMYQQVLQ